MPPERKVVSLHDWILILMMVEGQSGMEKRMIYCEGGSPYTCTEEMRLNIVFTLMGFWNVANTITFLICYFMKKKIKMWYSHWVTINLFILANMKFSKHFKKMKCGSEEIITIQPVICKPQMSYWARVNCCDKNVFGFR